MQTAPHSAPLVFVPSSEAKANQGKSIQGKTLATLMPDNSELTIELAENAFAMIGRGNFSVSASLSVDNAESLRNYGLFQSILLMAYREGQRSVGGMAPASVA